MTEIIENREPGFLSLYIRTFCIAVCRKGKELLYNAIFRSCPSSKKIGGNRLHRVGRGGGEREGTTQVYPDDGLKILRNPVPSRTRTRAIF
jgi:hypothetical protein